VDVSFAYMHSMCLFACIVVTFSGVKLVSVPDPKPIPSTNRFQYQVLYWKRYTRWMRSEDKTRVKLRVIVSQATIHTVSCSPTTHLGLICEHH